jgi:hypothetical protein
MVEEESAKKANGKKKYSNVNIYNDDTICGQESSK